MTQMRITDHPVGCADGACENIFRLNNAPGTYFFNDSFLMIESYMTVWIFHARLFHSFCEYGNYWYHVFLQGSMATYKLLTELLWWVWCLCFGSWHIYVWFIRRQFVGNVKRYFPRDSVDIRRKDVICGGFLWLMIALPNSYDMKVVRPVVIWSIVSKCSYLG